MYRDVAEIHGELKAVCLSEVTPIDRGRGFVGAESGKDQSNNLIQAASYKVKQQHRRFIGGSLSLPGTGMRCRCCQARSQ